MMDIVDTPSDLDTGIACLVMLARYFRVPAEPEQIRHNLGLSGRLSDVNDVLRMAKDLGFRARKVASPEDQLQRLSLPAIAELQDGGFCILARASDTMVLIQHPGRPTPEELLFDQFKEIWSGSVVLLTTRATLSGSMRRFDIAWFIPAIVKYRRLFGEVFVASFFCNCWDLLHRSFFNS